MKAKFLIPVVLALGVLIGTPSVLAQGTAESDYRYQLDQYRRYYAQYQNYKKDYDTRPSLDNEQKAIISAKQTITARELAWANFYLLLSQNLRTTAISYPLVSSALANLNILTSYHFSQVALVEKIATRSDLTSLTTNHLATIPSHILPLIQAQVAAKLAQLIKLQTEAEAAYRSLVPLLAPVKEEIVVQNGLSQIESYGQQINSQIESLAKKVFSLPPETNNSSRFFEEASIALSEIRTSLRRLVDVIIDLDTNYVAH